MTGKHVLMIDNYDSFTWNIYQYLCQSELCDKVDVYRNDKITIEMIDKINPDLIFISPGPGHPSTDAGISKKVIDHYKGKLPIIGVCMGLQCMFEVFGGEVSYAGEIVHGKTTSIKHDSKGMFSGVPQSVSVTRYHSLAGTLKSLPDCLEVTASTETEPNVIMGVRHKEYCIEGVQFHPESILTESGRIMIDNLLSFNGGKWNSQPGDISNTVSVATRGTASGAGNGTTSGTTSGGSGNGNILDKIYAQRQKDYDEISQLPGKSFEELEIYLKTPGIAPTLINFYDRLISTQKNGKNIILSEFKRASPSKGIINIKANPITQSLTYSHNGCSTILILTEPHWFKGSLDDLKLIRKSIDSQSDRPAILRKEFIFNKYQILESRIAGADTILLIVKMLKPETLIELYNYSHSLGMIPLVEINNEQELKLAINLNYNDFKEPLIIGVNNRNLTNFNVDLNTTTDLLKSIKNNDRSGDVLVLSLSGITSIDDVKNYKLKGVDGFLIGESLMRAEERGEADVFLDELCSC